MEHIFKEIKDESSEYHLSVEFDENEFRIQVWQPSNVLTATISKDNLESHAKLVNKETENYYEMLRKYFVNTPDYVKFVLTGKEFIVYVDFKIKFFSCKLKKDNFNDCAIRLIQKFYTEKTLFSADLKRVSDQRHRLLEEKLCLENQLKHLVETKRSIENEMYNSFVMVLNEKKMRIQHLNELIETFRQGRPTVNPDPIKKNARTKKVKQEIQMPIKDELSSSESEKSYNTDEENPGEDHNDFPLSPQMPSTSKLNLDLLSDESPDECALPKRKKPTPLVDTLNMPSTSKMAVKEEVQSMEMETTGNADENSPVVELSTQDLLDCI